MSSGAAVEVLNRELCKRYEREIPRFRAHMEAMLVYGVSYMFFAVPYWNKLIDSLRWMHKAV